MGCGAGAGVAEVRGAGVVRVAEGVEVEVGAVGSEIMVYDDDPVERLLDFCLEDDKDNDAGFEWWYCWNS